MKRMVSDMVPGEDLATAEPEHGIHYGMYPSRALRNRFLVAYAHQRTQSCQTLTQWFLYSLYISIYIIDYQYDYNCVYTPVLDRFLTLGFIPRRPFYPDPNSRRFFCADSSEDLRTLAVVRHAIRCLQHWEFHLKSWRFTRNHGISPASFLTGYPLNMLIAGFLGIEVLFLACWGTDEATSFI